MAENAINLILQQKPALVLLAIGREGRTYASLISREIESTFAHTANILSKLEDLDLIKFEPDGSDNRVKEVELTSKGKTAVELIKELVSVLEDKQNGYKKSTPQQKKAVSREGTRDFVKKLKMIESQIEFISKEELEGKKKISQDSFSRIGRRLGPYRRELRKIMKSGKEEDVKHAEGLDKMIDKVFEIKEGLRE